MEGFYSKAEAAHILGVSARQVQNYVNDGRLRRAIESTKSYIPIADVEKLYSGRRKNLSAKVGDITPLEERIKALEEVVEILKLGLGCAAGRSDRPDAELLLLRQRVLDDLAKTSWPIQRMSSVADDLATLSEKDVARLCTLKGPTAWVPLFDLCKRTLAYMERHPSYPGNGLDTLHARMGKARDRLYGLITAATKVKSPLSTARATEMQDLLCMKPGAVDKFITTYIVENASTPE